MGYYDDEDGYAEHDPREIETIQAVLECHMCGRPGPQFACFSCGRPVCYPPNGDFYGTSPCGAWILDTWHPSHPDENEFYCNICLAANLVPESGVGIVDGKLTFQINDGALQVTIGGRAQYLSPDEARNLIAYLFCGRGDLFGPPYDPDSEPVRDPPPNNAIDDLELGELADHPF